MIRRNFFTGLALLLPIVLTFLILAFFINLFTKPFLNAVEGLLSHYGLMDISLFFLNAEQLRRLISKILIVATLVGVTFFAGSLAQIVVTRYLIRLGDDIIHRIPIVNSIYRAAKEVVNTVFSEQRKTFSQVVLVPFPHKKAYSIGMVANECVSVEADKAHAGMVSVFVPATPNPTMGFMLMFQRDHLVFLDMKVEDALKAIVSCGVIISEITKKKNQTD